MVIKKLYKFLNKLPKKLNLFYKNKYRSNLIIKNKSKSKKKFDPVTNFDKSFEKYIRSLILKKFPTHSVIGEELRDKKSDNLYKWIIDPIDGTKVFILGGPTWSNLIGLSYNDVPCIGLANFPDLNCFYLNDQTKAYLYRVGKKYKLSSSQNKNLKNSKKICNFHGQLSLKKQNYIINKLGPSLRVVSFDALNYCLLAEGKLDVVIEANLKIYDILPLIPIIENSGAIVTNWNIEPAYKGGNILASANRSLHNKILKILKPLTK